MADKKVSVCLVTYNHEKYIHQAVKSAVNQITNFDYEIIVGDDYSTDNTREILKKLQQEHPDKIKLVLHPKNLGLNGKYNFTEIYNQCNGEYVALLEGDDYWTDSQKLQIQVDFLDKNIECSMCFHPNIFHYENNEKSDTIGYPPGRKKTYSIIDILKNNFIGTATVVFRRENIKKIPEWYYRVLPGDHILHILNAQKGKIGYIDRIMAVYRRHDKSLWSSTDRYTELSRSLETRKEISRHISAEENKVNNAAISSILMQMYELSLINKKYSHSTRDIFSALKLFNIRYGKLKNLCRLLALAYIPGWSIIYSYILRGLWNKQVDIE